MIRDLRIALIVAALVTLTAWGLWLWYAPKPQTSKTTFTEATPATTADKEEVQIKSIKALKKSVVAKKLDLPKSIAEDPKQVILDAVTVPPTRGGATAVAVLDTDTGETRTMIRAKPPPLFSLERGGEAGIRYGLSTDGTAAAMFVRQDIARVGNVYASGYAEASAVGGRGEGRAMLQITYRW
jgi:hypothetical protein